MIMSFSEMKILGDNSLRRENNDRNMSHMEFDVLMGHRSTDDESTVGHKNQELMREV